MKSNTFRSNLHAVLLVMAAMFVFSASAAAQSHGKANIPFDFKVGNTTLSAGEYTIERVSTNSHELLALRDSTGARRAIVNGVRAETLDKYSEPRLVFTKYAQGNLLSEIWLSTESGVSVPKTRFERELILGSGAKKEAVAMTGAQ
jgi:hypothetical protein